MYGWGIVAPKSPNVEAFRRNLASAETWLTPFNGFGPDSFLVGTPDFRFSDYEHWIRSRFAPRHYQKLKEKMGMPSLYAIGAFIQSLAQNPGIENELRYDPRTTLLFGDAKGALTKVVATVKAL